jgi:hypothetical protein
VTGSYLPSITCPSTPPPNPTGGIVAVLGNGDYTTQFPNIQVVPIAGPGFSYATVATPEIVNDQGSGIVNSCSVDQSTDMAVCTDNGNNVYEIDTAFPSSSPEATLTDGGTGFNTFSGGQCETCGVVVDSIHHQAVIGVGLDGSNSGYQLLNLLNNQFGKPIVAQTVGIAENWGVDEINSRILSGTEGVGGNNGMFQIFDISNPSAPVIYNYLNSSAFGPIENFDSLALDSTGIGVGTAELLQVVWVVDLSQITFVPPAPGSNVGSVNAPAQPQTLGPEFASFLHGLTAITVANGSHLALVADEFGTSAFGALQLPATSGIGLPAIVDSVTGQMPNDPLGNLWEMTNDPHGIAAADVCLAGNRALGMMVNRARTFIAVIDLAKILAAPRLASTGAIDPTYDLVGNGAVSFVAVVPGRLQLSPTSVAFGTVKSGTSSSLSLTLHNNSNVGILTGSLNLNGLFLPFSVTGLNGTSFAIGPSDSLSLLINFAPPTPGPYSASIVITTNDPANPSTTVGISGTGG